MNPITQFVDWLLEQLGKGFDWLVEQVVIPPPPAWIVDGFNALAGICAQAGQLSYWVPIPVLVAVLAWMAVLVLAAIGIQVVRIIASFATLGGGAT